ncbi:anti-sigma factor [Methylobacterium sp. Leaf466]|uniref:anti-sigma factor family protein n=1 Tax=Methylobacterium sp. Leaf466 TaxID=1736386 RepID=UPI0006FA2798|nr:anti-sigma factor [Methylobacterium sp. Leaf466]KQT87215.1 anti-sigma factor [Methylobacterium sp. Leaf466]
MTEPSTTDPITEHDLIAYVDGELAIMRRLDVEAHLARHPDVAARVMAELHDRDALREAFAQPPTPGPQRNREAARRLDRSLAWGRFTDRLRRAAAIAMLVGAGWLAHSDVGAFGIADTQASPIDPALMADAQQAREAARIRARIASQRLAPAYDQAGIEAATGILLPALPAGWTVKDVQVFPSRTGAGIEVAIEAEDLGELALFATHRPDGDATSAPVTRSQDGGTAYWTDGRSAYLLSGAADGERLGKAAARMAAKGDRPQL